MPIFVDIVDISLDMNLKPLFIYMNVNTPISILTQVRAKQADLSVYQGNPSTKTTKVTLPKEAVEMARTIDAALLKQFTFLWSGQKHKDLTPDQMLGKVQHNLARLKPYCDAKNGGAGEGYPDPNSEFAESCLSTWSHEYNEIKKRLSQ